MKKPGKLAMLCDYGLDDAVATAYILYNADKFELIDILPIGGNFPPEVSFGNAKRLLSNYKITENVRIVNTLGFPQPFESLPDIHGGDGMGDVLDGKSDFAGEIINYADWIKTVDKDYTLLSLGPCTLTADILSKAGALPLIMMCGNIKEAPNFKGYEFNHCLDRKAFSECVKYPHVTATLDTCHHEKCDFYKINLDGESLFCRLARGAVKLSNKRGEKLCTIYDLVAAVYLLHPEKFASEKLTDRDGNRVTVLKYTDNALLTD